MKILQLAASSVLALLILSGCSAGHDYWGNRLDDAKDIFTFTAGGGFGVKVQVGPVQADMYNYASLYGLRSGEILDGAHPHSEEYHVSEGNIGVPLPFANTEIFYPGKYAAERGKAYCAMSPLLPFFILLPDEHSRNFCNSCAWKEKFRNREAQKTSEDASPELEKDENSPSTAGAHGTNIPPLKSLRLCSPDSPSGSIPASSSTFSPDLPVSIFTATIYKFPPPRRLPKPSGK